MKTTSLTKRENVWKSEANLKRKLGKGSKPNAAKALSDEEVNILYEKNLLGIAEALLNTLWLLNSVHFGLRGCEEHRQMAWGDVKLPCKKLMELRNI